MWALLTPFFSLFRKIDLAGPKMAPFLTKDEKGFYKLPRQVHAPASYHISAAWRCSLANTCCQEDGPLGSAQNTTDLSEMHEPAILYNTRQRFFANKPFTFVGDIVLAVNPYK